MNGPAYNGTRRWDMTYQERATQLARDFEGCKFEPYKDSMGFWTIGYGYNMEAHGVTMLGAGPPPTFKICEAQAEAWLHEEIEIAESDARKLYVDFDALPDRVKATLIDLAYNMGYPKLAQFVHMNAAVNDCNWANAAMELTDSRYFGQTGRRARFHVELFRTLAIEAGQLEPDK